jgi:hypothetical protein
MIDRLHPDTFNWSTWRSGAVSDLGISFRKEIILENAYIFRKYAIGYLEGEHLICRPKINHTAVMFLKDSYYFWFHLRNDEFKEVFKNET